MGFFKKLGNSVSATLTGGAFNTKGKGWAQGGNAKQAFLDPLAGGFGGDILKGKSFEDVLYGEKKKVKADTVANMVKKGQQKGVSELNSALDSTNAEQLVNQQTESAKKGILASAEDARRNAQAVMARRGLANSSLGLAQNRTITQNAGDQVAEVNARMPGMIRDQKLADAQTRINQGGLGAQNPIQWNTTTNRGGGLLDLAGQLAPIAGSVMGMQNMAASTKNLNAQSNYLNKLKPGQSGGGFAPAAPGQGGLFDGGRYSMGNYQF